MKVVLDFGEVSFTEALLRLSLMARTTGGVVKHSEFAMVNDERVPIVRIVKSRTVVPLTTRPQTITEPPQPAA